MLKMEHGGDAIFNSDPYCLLSNSCVAVYLEAARRAWWQEVAVTLCKRYLSGGYYFRFSVISDFEKEYEQNMAYFRQTRSV